MPSTASAEVSSDKLEEYRRELTGYCYRMLGSGFEADDAVQETMLRAWRAADGFEGRSSVRSWLYRIATNICLDMLRGRQRRALPMDLGPASPPVETLFGDWRADEAWISPSPTSGSCPSTATRPTSRWPGTRSGWRSSPRYSTCRPGSGPP